MSDAASSAQASFVAEVESLRDRIAALEAGSVPVDEAVLAQAERLHKAVLELDGAVCEVRDALMARAVELRWTYQRIADATGLSVARVGQLAPRRPRSDGQEP